MMPDYALTYRLATGLVPLAEAGGEVDEAEMLSRLRRAGVRAPTSAQALGQARVIHWRSLYAHLVWRVTVDGQVSEYPGEWPPEHLPAGASTSWHLVFPGMGGAE